MALFDLLRRRAPSVPAAQMPAGRRVYAIGDVHGSLALLDELLAAIERDDAARGPAESEIIFLGDLVDRGPDSAGVLDRVIGLVAAGRAVRVIQGNHEEVMLLAAGGDRSALALFNRIGGRETMLSYGLDAHVYDGLDLDGVEEALGRLVPSEHFAFMRAMEPMIAIGDYAFVHAGIRPRRPLDEQDGSDLRWIRSSFLDFTGSHGAVVVHGHTISDEPEERDNRVGIDTGAYATGRLTALGLEGGERWFLATGVG